MTFAATGEQVETVSTVNKELEDIGKGAFGMTSIGEPGCLLVDELDSLFDLDDKSDKVIAIPESSTIGEI